MLQLRLSAPGEQDQGGSPLSWQTPHLQWDSEAGRQALCQTWVTSIYGSCLPSSPWLPGRLLMGRALLMPPSHAPRQPAQFRETPSPDQVQSVRPKSWWCVPESAVLADAAAVFILPCAPLKGWLSQLPLLCRPAQASGPGCRLRTGCARRPTWTAPTTAAPGALSSPQAAKTVLPTGNAEPYAGAATWALGFRQRCRLLRLKLTTLHYPSCDAEAAIRALGGRQRCRQLALELTLWHHPSCDTEPAPGCIHLECNSSSLPGVFVDC